MSNFWDGFTKEEIDNFHDIMSRPLGVVNKVEGDAFYSRINLSGNKEDEDKIEEFSIEKHVKPDERQYVCIGQGFTFHDGYADFNLGPVFGNVASCLTVGRTDEKIEMLGSWPS